MGVYFHRRPADINGGDKLTGASLGHLSAHHASCLSVSICLHAASPVHQSSPGPCPAWPSAVCYLRMCGSVTRRDGWPCCQDIPVSVRLVSAQPASGHFLFPASAAPPSVLLHSGQPANVDQPSHRASSDLNRCSSPSVIRPAKHHQTKSFLKAALSD